MISKEKRLQNVKAMFGSDEEDKSSSSDDGGTDYLSQLIKKRGKLKRKSLCDSNTDSYLYICTLRL